jgi:site-specific recombinase XerD
MVTDRYPDNQMDFAEELPEEALEFADRRESLLLNYGYNTARAYYGDLQDWYEWAVARGKNVLDLSESDQKQYIALLRRRKYSENTIRRKCIAIRLLYREA